MLVGATLRPVERLEYLGFPTDQANEPIIIDACVIATGEVAIVVDRGVSGALAEVPGEHTGAANLQFAVIRQANLAAWQGMADRAKAESLGAVQGDRNDVFTEAIGFQNR